MEKKLFQRTRVPNRTRPWWYLPLFLLLLQFPASMVMAQSRQISGVVTDVKGKPLQGVSVNIKGSTNGVTTDADGKYTISLPADKNELEFSSVGYLAKVENIGARTTISLSLSESTSNLDDVVVIGYGGKQKKRDVTGSISSVSSKQIEERQPINLFDALQGQGAGILVVNDGGGAPGAEGSIQIRGASSLNAGNGPLYLVDGVINPNGASISPMDIERIEVLKDAASASIYGSRAANGVIIITTKKGKEGKPRIDLNYTSVFGKLAHKLPINNAQGVRDFRRLQNDNPGAGGNTDSLNPGFNSDNDLQDLLLGETAIKQQVNLGVSGGRQGLTYYTGLNYLDDKSIIPNSYVKRLQARINVDYQASPKLKYSNNITFVWQKGNAIPVARTVNVVFDRPSFSRIFYPDGSLTSYIGSKRNPLANALYEKNEQEIMSGQLNNNLQYQIYKDLTFTTTFNAILENRQNIQFSPRILSSNRDQNNGSNEMAKNFYWEYQAFFNYNKKIGDHNIQGVVGFNADKRRNDLHHSEFKNVVNEEVFVTFPSYLVPTETYTNAVGVTSQSLFTRWNYSYKGTYNVSGVYRRDGSSRFGPENKYGNFFSGSASWRFSDAKFMQWAWGFLNDARVRVGYGQVGNDQIGYYDHLTKYQFDGSYGGVGSAYTSNRFGNAFVKWETVEQKNAAIELSFFKGRLQFSTEYYIKTTKELLYDRPLANETGFSVVTTNVGTIRNRGLEFVVSGTPIVGKGFNWDISGNISFERGDIVELANHASFVAGNKWYVEEGKAIGNFFGWKNLGVYQWDESNAYTRDWQKLTVVLDKDGKPLYENGKASYSYNGQPYTDKVYSLYDPSGKLKGGDTEWQNMNTDSLINDADRHVIGNYQPDFYLGIVNNFRYKQWGLSVLINASWGGMIYNTLQYNANYPTNTGPGSPQVLANSWRKQGDVATMPYYPQRTNRGSLKQHGNSLYLEDRSFVRLSNVRLTYTLKPSLANKVFAKGITAFVFGQNLLTYTNYTGYDPEFSSNNVLTPGDDTGKYPKRREVGLGVNINF
ncbi:SusC/RagA family TonB-linked outer membrane protein [Paraflavitalea sp. CAU 1676]|uniref:SusC/RagA family TonB-linked outer membrane protein n=1 Tax=Paraflavitalea sp. CAU 1676 TaxID=3032598 RepID=UPI0023DCDFE6|nr:SusC/RagA family TonB-linked outer membrane protein [Paraflavitalea sp. CAU 1676]MDF2193302.1 SusC/RagA family TonB-linked outer membrane protein [Paraflavitalea sp. CAU 1676]